MALKTCLRLLLSKYGVMSVEMQRAYIDDSADTVTLADEKIADDTFDGEVIEAEAVAVTDIPEDATEN
jgi:recombination protein RecT